MNPQIIVKYLADTTALKAAQSDVAKSTGKTAGFARKAFLPAVGALGALTLVAGKATGQASDLNEAVSASTVLFGDNAAEMEDWAETMAKSAGLSTREALEASNAFGNMFTTVGLGADETAKMSQDFVQLAGDMASFHNQDPSDMLLRLRSGLAGEAEPLRRFGVLLSEGRVAAEALASGLVKPTKNMGEIRDAQTRVNIALDEWREAVKEHGKGSTEAAKKMLTVRGAQRRLDDAVKGGKVELTDAQKVIARQKIIMDDTAKAQGNFADTSGEVANQQRTMAAETENAGASFGQSLLPVTKAVQDVFIAILGPLAKYPALLQALAAAVLLVSGAIIVLNAGMAVSAALGIALLPAIGILAGVVLGVVALVAIGLILWKKWDTISAGLSRAWDAIKGGAKAVFDWLRKNWPLVLGILTGPLGLAVALVIKHWDKIKSAVKSAVDFVKDRFNDLVGFFRGLAGTIGRTIQRVADAIKGPINAIIGGLNAVRIPPFDFHADPLGKFGPSIDFHFGGADLFPDIPKLAAGAIVTRPTLALIGEAGPEAVVPLGGSMGGPLVVIEQFTAREELDVNRIAARLSAAVAARV